MPNSELARIAQEYADLLNRVEPAAVGGIIDEACVEPNWDERTNLYSMQANAPEDLALVLSSEPGGDDYLVVRFVGEWVVDYSVVDWDELEEEVFDPEGRRWIDTA